MEFQDKVLKCIDCGSDFIFTAGEQLFFHDKQFKNEPKRCKACKTKRVSVLGAPPAPGQNRYTKVETQATCSGCGKQTTVPFRPTQGRPVFCRECFHVATDCGFGLIRWPRLGQCGAGACSPAAFDVALSAVMRRVRYHRVVPGYYVENFGCRATQADGAALERQFEERGMTRASTPSEASVVVMNTCTVTAGADQDARAAIRRVRRQNPEANIVVTGCYAQRAPEEIAALPGVSLVIGNSHKHQLAEIVSAQTRTSDLGPQTPDPAFIPLAMLGTIAASSDQRAENPPSHRTLKSEVQGPASQSRATTDDQGPIFVSDIFAHTELLAAPVFDAANERTRPNLKVQDGCDNRCSFCVIPYVRGQSRSLEIDRILREVTGLVESGYREVVISGINLGRWGRDLDVRPQPTDLGQTSWRLRSKVSEVREPQVRKPALEGLIRAILAETASGKTPHLLRRAHGLDRRSDFPGRILATHRQARARAHAIRQ